MRVSYSEVSHAVQQLVVADKVFTVENIGLALGTGSNSTLGSNLRTLELRQEQTKLILRLTMNRLIMQLI